MTQEIDRKVVSIGIDFRPLPVDVGDGEIWLFHPDPSPAKIDALMAALRGIGATGKAMREDDDNADATLGGALGSLTGTIGDLLVKPEQRKAWLKKDYGLAVLTQLSNALVEQIAGFPTKPSAPSGKG